MPKKWTWRNLARKQDLEQLGIAVNRPGVELAEKVGRFAAPFDYLKSVSRGFDPFFRFLLNRTLTGDQRAIAVRDFVAAMMRYRRLNEAHSYTTNIERSWAVANNDEFMTFFREHYPWVFAAEWAGGEIHEPDPETDALLDHYVCERLAEYGFTTKTRKFKKNYWRCHSSLLSRRITIEFDKGRLGTNLSGDLRVDDIGYSASLADPFFFSGCVFHASKVQQLPLQMERFFGEYNRIFPHVIAALEEAIAAADDVLATASRRSVT
jgi:hypothetical protein